MLNEELKNAANAINGMCKEITGQKMKILDNLNLKL
jgi:hypothetical protein